MILFVSIETPTSLSRLSTALLLLSLSPSLSLSLSLSHLGRPRVRGRHHAGGGEHGGPRHAQGQGVVQDVPLGGELRKRGEERG